jgi:hypothetical protein
LAGRTRGSGEVLRLEVLDVELGDALAHGLQNIFSRAWNKIRKPTTAGEITELLKGDLDQGGPPFQGKDAADWLQNANNREAGETGKLASWP